MKKNKMNNVDYTELVDFLNNWLDIQETKNRTINSVLPEFNKILYDGINIIPNWEQKHLNNKTILLLEKLVPDNVTPQQIYVLIRRFLEYNTEITDFSRIQNIYTLLRYYNNPEELQCLATNWKDIMSKKRYKN